MHPHLLQVAVFKEYMQTYHITIQVPLEKVLSQESLNTQGRFYHFRISSPTYSHSKWHGLRGMFGGGGLGFFPPRPMFHS